MKGILEEYWRDENFSELYPHADSIPDMPLVDNPFVLFRKDLEAFGGGPVRERVQGQYRFRRKEEHRS